MRPIIGNDSFKFVDRGHPKHPRAKRSGMWKSLAVPAHMFAHAVKLALATECLKLSSVIEQDGKALTERDRLACTRLDTGTTCFTCERASLFL
jgi:hypothetical protein